MKLEQELIYNLSKKLDEFHYEALMSIAIDASLYKAPFSTYGKVKLDMKRFDEHTRSVLQFFFLGEVCDIEIMRSFLGMELMQYLFDIGILDYDEWSCWLNSFLIIPYMNCYFLVSNSVVYPTCQESIEKVSVDSYSYLLAHEVINEVNGRVLNLSSGCGFITILSAKVANEVVAVENDPVAIQISKFNACLNGVEDKIIFREGNWFENIESEKFDYIIVNLESIYCLADFNLKKVEYVKEKESRLLSDVLNVCKNNLVVGGHATIVGNALGNSKYIFGEDVIRRECKDMTVQLLAWDNKPSFSILSKVINKGKNNESLEEIEEQYISQGITECYKFKLFLSNKIGEHSIVYSYDNWTGRDIANASISRTEKIGELYGIYSTENTMFICTEEQKCFIEQIDGKKTIEEILEEFPLQYKINYSSSERNMLSIYLPFCGLLERMNVILKAGRKNI